MAKRCRVTFTCSKENVGAWSAILAKAGVEFSVARIVEKPQEILPLAPLKTEGQPVVEPMVRPPTPRNKLGVYRKRVPGRKTKDTEAGRAILSVFTTFPKAYGPDFAKALEAAGFAGNGWCSYIGKLMRERAVVRIAHGVYRLPTASEAV